MKSPSNKANGIHLAILLAITFFFYSLSGIFSKLASLQPPFSFAYFGYIAAVIVVLGVYASLWQNVLAVMPLNKAYLCKSITLIIGLCIAHWMFAETITIYNIIGAGFIFAGIVVVSFKTKAS